MEFVNIKDERDRINELRVYDLGKNGQFDSHSVSSARYLDSLRDIGKTVLITGEGMEEPDFKYLPEKQENE